MLVQITPANAEEILGGELPVVLDFYTKSCGPCMKVAEVMKELADELDSKVIIGKVDCEENDDLVFEHRVMAVPTVLLVKNGKAVKRISGAPAKQAFLDEINKNLL